MPATHVPLSLKKVGRPTTRRRDEAAFERDRELLDRIVKGRDVNRSLLAAMGEEREPLSVYSDRFPNEEEHFPITHLSDGRPVPGWNRLTEWLKAHLALLALVEFKALAITANLHRAYEAELLGSGADVRRIIRDDLSRHLKRAFGRNVEFFFVIEGRDQAGHDKTKLHIHGAVLADEPVAKDRIRRALLAATGHDPDKLPVGRPPVRLTPTNETETRWTEYLYKNVHKPDNRLLPKRLAMSRTLNQAAQDLWSVITLES